MPGEAPRAKPIDHVVRLVDASAMRDAVAALCRPEFAGRAAGSPGQALARRWLAAELGRMGLWVREQAFPLSARRAAGPAAARWAPPGGRARVLRRWVDFAEHPRSAPVPAPARGPVLPWETGTAARGAWVLLPPGRGVAANTLQRLQEVGALGILVPQAGGAGGHLPKLLSAAEPWPLPALRVRADRAARLVGGELEAVIPEAVVEQARGVNLLAGLPGGGQWRVLVGAHYDGVGDDPDGTRFPGASDNASGVAVVLQVARVLARTGPPPGLDVAFAFFDAEELGARGSAHLARTLAGRQADGSEPAAVINVDHVARWRGAVWTELGPGSEALRAALDLAGRELGIPLREGPVASDHRPFAAAGFPAAGLATGGERGHLPGDVPGAVGPAPMVRVARLVLGALWHLAAALQGR